jgi:adenosylmethionine-8-amino-7-oxononanoate aminotransferase
VYVFDEDGKRYLDAIGGVGVVNIGHGVEEIVKAMSHQARTLAYCYGGEVISEPQQMLARKLDEWAPDGMGETKTLFSSGGAEANEGALKLAHQYHWERGNASKHKIIGRWQSYHGNTIGALSMSGRTAWRRVFSHYLLDFPHIPPPYCYRCPWGRSYPGCGLECAGELERVISQEEPENVAAFIAEPVIGTSMSSVVPPPVYYPAIREICDRHDILLIVDEVMSGVGRTGKKWGIEHWGVTPDIITTSKVTERVEREAFKRGLMVLGGLTGLIDGKAGDHFQLLPPYTVEDEHLEFMTETVRETIVAATSNN